MQSRHSSFGAFGSGTVKPCFAQRNCNVQIYLASALTLFQSAQVDYSITTTGDATNNVNAANSVTPTTGSFTVGATAVDLKQGRICTHGGLDAEKGLVGGDPRDEHHPVGVTGSSPQARRTGFIGVGVNLGLWKRCFKD